VAQFTYTFVCTDSSIILDKFVPSVVHTELGAHLPYDKIRYLFIMCSKNLTCLVHHTEQTDKLKKRTKNKSTSMTADVIYEFSSVTDIGRGAVRNP